MHSTQSIEMEVMAILSLILIIFLVNIECYPNSSIFSVLQETNKNLVDFHTDARMDNHYIS